MSDQVWDRRMSGAEAREFLANPGVGYIAPDKVAEAVSTLLIGGCQTPEAYEAAARVFKALADYMAGGRTGLLVQACYVFSEEVTL